MPHGIDPEAARVLGAMITTHRTLRDDYKRLLAEYSDPEPETRTVLRPMADGTVYRPQENEFTPAERETVERFTSWNTLHYPLYKTYWSADNAGRIHREMNSWRKRFFAALDECRTEPLEPILGGVKDASLPLLALDRSRSSDLNDEQIISALERQLQTLTLLNRKSTDKIPANVTKATKNGPLAQYYRDQILALTEHSKDMPQKETLVDLAAEIRIDPKTLTSARDGIQISKGKLNQIIEWFEQRAPQK